MKRTWDAAAELVGIGHGGSGMRGRMGAEERETLLHCATLESGGRGEGPHPPTGSPPLRSAGTGSGRDRTGQGEPDPDTGEGEGHYCHSL